MDHMIFPFSALMYIYIVFKIKVHLIRNVLGSVIGASFSVCFFPIKRYDKIDSFPGEYRFKERHSL